MHHSHPTDNMTDMTIAEAFNWPTCLPMEEDCGLSATFTLVHGSSPGFLKRMDIAIQAFACQLEEHCAHAWSSFIVRGTNYNVTACPIASLVKKESYPF
jgi:hypothetical protein